jgi:hypothetical protein
LTPRVVIAGDVTGLLADRLALALLDHGALPCERVARVVGARTAIVRDVLRGDSRFERVGSTRGSRWGLVLALDGQGRNGHGRPWDGMGRNLGAGERVTDGLDVAARLGSLERRLDAVDRRLVCAEVPAA